MDGLTAVGTKNKRILHARVNEAKILALSRYDVSKIIIFHTDCERLAVEKKSNKPLYNLTSRVGWCE